MNTTYNEGCGRKYRILKSQFRRLVPLLCLGVGGLLVTGVAAQTNVTSANVLSNGSFELEGVKRGKLTPEGWGFYGMTNTFVGGYVVDGGQQVHSGEKAVSISGETPVGMGMWLSNLFEVKPGTAYSVEGWVKTTECTGKGAWLWVNAYEKKDGGAVGIVAWARPVIFFSGTEDWREWSAQIYIQKKTRWLKIACRLDGPGTAWFDDIQVSELE